MEVRYETIRLILGDQLNQQHSWFKQESEAVLYVMMETRSETDYVKHHIQKVIAFFVAMRQFRDWLSTQGHQVIYLKLDDPENGQDIVENITTLAQKHQVEKVQYQLPDEYRLDQALSKLKEHPDFVTESFDTEHFLTERMEVADLFKGKKQFLMETFYRKMRKKYGILMSPDGKAPLTGKWNYDHDNRKKLPKKLEIPELKAPTQSVAEVYKMIQKVEIETIGTVNPAHFIWPTNREAALQVLDTFLKERLANFGKYQDAMTTKDPFLFHSRLSFALNAKILHPLEVVQKAEQFWKDNTSTITIAQTEGFIRQIIGWREYMRGIYWAKMPSYRTLNFFDHQRSLPGWFWTGETKMTCLQHSIGQSLSDAYAHHIQRLMVTGNFALLLGVHPDEVDEWYLGIYIDAIEWVEITNTRGMSQFADGGIVGTKPYVSSANYIHKMGDYCSQCAYDRTAKIGPKACPFNSLYWDFYDRHRNKLGNNPRIGMMYRVWDKRTSDEKIAILKQAHWVKENIETL